MCKKQSSVSHSSTESEITSLDAGLRLDGITALTLGIWSLQFLMGTLIKVIKNGETRTRTYVRFVQHLTNFKNERSLIEWLMIWTMLILFPQTSILLVRKLCCMCLKTPKQWSRRSLKEGVPTMRHVSQNPQSCSWLVVRSNQFGPKIQINQKSQQNRSRWWIWSRGKDSWCATFYCIRKPGENQTRKSISSELANWAAS